MRAREHIKAEQAAAARVPADGLSVGLLMSRARMSVLTSLDAELEPFGLTGVQYGVLKHLAERTGGTAADLCRAMHYDTGSMTRMLDRLEEKGFLRRERCKDDRRVVYLRLTTAGREHLPRLHVAAVRVFDRHLAGFSPAEIDNLKHYLGRMIENGQPARHGT
jgi:MarR family transcriptional regulator, multiple antibiotic resistance protein MarR